jgi:hypothetical protein
VNPTDTQAMKGRLTEFADAVGARAPGEAGLKAWYIALKDFAIDEVVDALDQWLRTKPKMPAPADIRLILAGRLSDRIERQAAAEKAEFANGARRILTDAQRAIGREHLAHIRAILSGQREHNPNDWWQAVMHRWRNGDELTYMQLVNARISWEKSGRPVEHAPPGVDVEAELERAAIQGEDLPY